MKSLENILYESIFDESIFDDDFGVRFDIENLIKFRDGNASGAEVEKMFKLCIAAQPGSKKFKNIPYTPGRQFIYAVFLTSNHGNGMLVPSFATNDYMMWYNFRNINDIAYGELNNEFGNDMKEQIKTINDWPHNDVYRITKETWDKISKFFNQLI